MILLVRYDGKQRKQITETKKILRSDNVQNNIKIQKGSKIVFILTMRMVLSKVKWRGDYCIDLIFSHH